MSAEFHFLRPLWLFALLAVPLIIVLLRSRAAQRSAWLRYIDESLQPYVLAGRLGRHSRWPVWIFSMVAALLILALAGPVWQRLPQPVYRSDEALVIALDLSRSMEAGDVRPSRLARARIKLRDILQLRSAGQTALVAFAGDAFVVSPLTDDVETIEAMLASLTTDIMPSQGSLLAPALALSAQLLEQAGASTGEVLVIGDGYRDTDATQNAARTLRSMGYRLSVLAVGTEQGDVVRLSDGTLVKGRDGQIVVAKLDGNAMAALAAAGGGLYRALSANDSDIDALLAQTPLGASEQVEQENLRADVWREEGPWLVLLCLPLAALAFRRGWLACFAFLFVLPAPPAAAGVWDDMWRTRDQQGQRAFAGGEYEDAAARYADPAWRAAAQFRAGAFKESAETLAMLDDAEAHYNRGNALAFAGEVGPAMDAYRAALARDPAHEDARYNLEQLEEMTPPQQQPQSGDSGDGEQDQNSQQGEQSQSSSGGEQNAQNDSSDDGTQQTDSSESSDSRQAGDSQQQGDASEADEQADDQSETQRSQTARTEEGGELSQASEQWLRRIPDDPGGLLRRKFRHQHRLRKGTRPTVEEPW